MSRLEHLTGKMRADRLECLAGSIAVAWLLWEETGNVMWFTSYIRSLRLLREERNSLLNNSSKEAV